MYPHQSISEMTSFSFTCFNTVGNTFAPLSTVPMVLANKVRKFIVKMKSASNVLVISVDIAAKKTIEEEEESNQDSEEEEQEEEDKVISEASETEEEEKNQQKREKWKL
ncbi:hypothetical protein CTI12_AA342360 [Artemisia annua]|uniref:Uncharacterized protein n=1 Tax=Artemisia annua TaxID=35608 RepID=A0A2U1MTP5_ARTAN|nr:hypothetical protein CTI12_AA342360 [Artemisia annua]